ncbi:hypothetical protein HZS_2336 [Henneguya salminicola]|nr:hypothetical protein HZS_2336 [Henneguya salminicola]
MSTLPDLIIMKASVSCKYLYFDVQITDHLYLDGKKFIILKSLNHVIILTYEYMFLSYKTDNMFNLIFNHCLELYKLFSRKIGQIGQQMMSIEKSKTNLYRKIGLIIRSLEFLLVLIPFIHKYFKNHGEKISEEITAKYELLKTLLKKNIDLFLKIIIDDLEILINSLLTKWVEEITTSPSIVVIRLTRYLEEVHGILVSILIIQDISHENKEKFIHYISQDVEFFLERIKCFDYISNYDEIATEMNKIIYQIDYKF